MQKLSLSRRAFAASAITLGAASLLRPALAAGDGQPSSDAPDQKGPAFTRAVFQDGNVVAVTSVTEVFGRSQRTTTAIVEYDQQIDQTGVSADIWTVEGRTITAAYANDKAEKTETGRTGKYVILELDPWTDDAITYAPNVEKEGTVVVSQVKPVKAASGDDLPATEQAIINTRQTNLIVDDFAQFRFTDPVTGLLLNYNLFIPADYDPERAYPLVLFMHDAGVTGTNPLRTLEQGLGAISFASPEDQAKNPAFVLAPQYPVALANDGSRTSDYPEITYRLIQDLIYRYNIDQGRIYTTGQSGGCMASIALNIAHPDFFAASLLVAGQWDPTLVSPMANNKLWIIVSQDDAKAYPGMQAITKELKANGARITEAAWNGRASSSDLSAAAKAQQKSGPDSNVYFSIFDKGTVIPEGVSNEGASGHVWTWPIAYDIPEVRDWLLSQKKKL